MADGPLDYDSGYFFESQKVISDRRGERGFPPGPSGTQWSGGSTGGAVERSGSGGGALGGFIIKFMVLLMIARVVGAVIAMIVAAWLFYHLVRAIWHILH